MWAAVGTVSGRRFLGWFGKAGLLGGIGRADVFRVADAAMCIHKDLPWFPRTKYRRATP